MYGRKTEGKQVFNGEGVMNFEEFREALLIKADEKSCGNHFRWKPEEVQLDGSVPEERLLYVRECAPGLEEEFAVARKDALLARLDQVYDLKVEAVEAGYVAGAERRKEIAKLDMKLIDDKELLENGLPKSVSDLRAATALFDKREKEFNDSKAMAVGLLNSWLGPNPLNKVHLKLRDIGPKNAWKMLVDEYTNEANTTLYINTVTAMMQTLVFDHKKKVEDHMGTLDKWNATLVRNDKGMSSSQLLNYLIDSIRRSKAGMARYTKIIDNIMTWNLPRDQAITMLVSHEHREYNEAQLRGEATNAQGAQFAKVREFAGAAAVQTKKRKPESGGGGGSRKSPRGDKGPGGLKCFRCGGSHLRKDCKEEVFCKPCNKNTHSEACCFKLHPELKEKFDKARRDKVGKSA
jgi:hypothetical protein